MKLFFWKGRKRRKATGTIDWYAVYCAMDKCENGYVFLHRVDLCGCPKSVLQIESRK